MALQLERFIVYYIDKDGETVERSITVRNVDMLRGELEHNRQGMPERGANMNLTAAWVWAALTREGDYGLPFADFRDRDLLGMEDGGQETVDPTRPATPEGFTSS